MLSLKGLQFNPKHEIVSEWKWIKPKLIGSKSTPNSLKYSMKVLTYI